MVVPTDPDPFGIFIGILAFETAATMSQLVSLHRSLSDTEILKLRSEVMRSQGVAYLNSTDQSLLLRLACAEMIADLDRAAAVISRLDKKCRGGALPNIGFDRVYTDLKSGAIDPDRLGVKKFAGKGVEKRMRKMEKCVAVTAKLYTEMEFLAEMEATERKKWGRNSGPIPIQKQSVTDSLQLDLKTQQQKVRRLKEDSLWNLTADKAVELTALSAYAVFARICAVFGPFVSGLPNILVNKENRRICFAASHLKIKIYPRSGPMERSAAPAKEVVFRNSCPIPRSTNTAADAKSPTLPPPPPNTVGGSGQAAHYANVILLAEKIMMSREEGEENLARDELYGMLPSGLRAAVRSKLRECWRDRGPLDGSLADGWKDAVWRILGWLGPVAHDTVQWQAERNMDRRRRFDTSPRTLMLQTLHFANREKTEAAIVEVLVGLSLVCWYDERFHGSFRYV